MGGYFSTGAELSSPSPQTIFSINQGAGGTVSLAVWGCCLVGRKPRLRSLNGLTASESDGTWLAGYAFPPSPGPTAGEAGNGVSFCALHFTYVEKRNLEPGGDLEPQCFAFL